MRLTFAEARALGLGHLCPDPARPPTAAPADGMNKLERSFRDDVLEPATRHHAIRRWAREPLKLRLAGRCWYTPDFLVLPRVKGRDSRDPLLYMVEIKGAYAREDSIVKLKVAADTYPEFTWLICYRRGRRGWRVHEVTDRGFSVNPIEVAWIHGGY